jgi:hypothetical protein
MNTCRRGSLAKGYTLVLISQGLNWDTRIVTIIWQHGRRNFGLRRQGVLAIVCPVGDDTLLAGLYSFSTDIETVTAIMEDDPGVLSGVFVFERWLPGRLAPLEAECLAITGRRPTGPPRRRSPSGREEVHLRRFGHGRA